jgi:predicted nicotinamide N-methyase
LRALEQLRGEFKLVGGTQDLEEAERHGPSQRKLAAELCAADLSVKKFSRRRLLQTGGIATRVWTASVLLARWMARHAQSVQAIAQCPHVQYASASDCDKGLFGSGDGRVLELGCGLGVGGIAAAMCGCSVLMTDIHDVALSSCQDAIRINAERLKNTASARAFVDGGHVASIDEFLKASEGCTRSGSGRAYTMELDWNHLPDLLPHQRFACIIAADVVHEDQHAPLISKVIRVCTHALQKQEGTLTFFSFQHMLAPYGVCLVANADAHSRYGMDVFPRQLEEEGLQVKLLLPLPLLPPASGEDETQSDVLDHQLMAITRMDVDACGTREQ